MSEKNNERFIATLRELGGSAGNGKLRGELGWQESTYERVKGELIEAGRIVAGRGRGGSVRDAAHEAAVGKVESSAPKQVRVSTPSRKSADRGSAFEQTFKSIDNILWKEQGCTTELDYTEQSSWLLFLKYLDALEGERAMEAELEGRNYIYLLDKSYRWENWAAPKLAGGRIDHNKAQTGDDLVDFVNDKLFPYLRGFKAKASGPQTLEYKIGEIFGEIKNKITSGYNLREIIDLVDELRFGSHKEKHELSHLYEAKIRNMGNAGRNGGEYYTPRPLIRAMIRVVNPEIGERIYDGACGSAGFLCEAFDYLSSKGNLSTG
ncbi:MAG: N-6 DNA methylase, partial [Pseudonocardiaceae bacterium]